MPTPEGLSEEHLQAIEKWSRYGQRGQLPQFRSQPWQWKTTPFSQIASAPWHVKLLPHQLPVLLMGFVPNEPSSYQDEMNIFIEGERITRHGFLSGSAGPTMKASEDKWFVYADGPNSRGDVRLHMFRSWSGIKEMELVLKVNGLGHSANPSATISSILWAADIEPYKTRGEAYAKKAARGVCNWVLNVQLGLDQDALAEY